MLVLQDVDVHQPCLATSGGHPESELVKLWPSLGGCVKRCDPVSLGLVRVVDSHLHVQRHEQRLWIAEVTVQVYLAEEQSQVLEVLPDDRHHRRG